MSDKELEDKIAYFKEQELLDISDDETGFPDDSYLRIERALADTKAMPPPKLIRQKSFLGPTPKERKAEFEAYSERQREQARNIGQTTLVRSNTAPEADVSRSFPAAKPNVERSPGGPAERYKIKRNVSLSDLPTPKANVHDEVPFYKHCGVIPRELKRKNAKKADNITLEPEHKQLFKGKIICMFVF
jgi:DNA polymerase IV